jgi:hypothetical protein
VIRALAVACALAGAAAAEPVEVLDGPSRWRLDLPPGFREEPVLELPDGVMLARHEDARGRRVTVARARGNTEGAYGDERAYFTGLEEGVRRHTPGYRRLAATQRKIGRRGKIPVYDLWWRADGAVRGSRFVLLRGYALVLTVHAPGARRVDPALKKTLESFTPP